MKIKIKKIFYLLSIFLIGLMILSGCTFNFLNSTTTENESNTNITPTTVETTTNVEDSSTTTETPTTTTEDITSTTEKLIYYTVSFDSNGGSEIDSITLLENSLIEKPDDPNLLGYTFNGWYYNDNLWDFSNDVITSDMTLIAKWDINQYSVSLTVNNILAGITLGSGNYDYNEEVIISASPYLGYTFIGWYDGDDLVDENATYSFNMPANDVSYTAKFKSNTNTKYICNHYLEKLDGDYEFYETEEFTGITEALTNVSSKTYEGYTAKSFDQAVISGDGSTEINIYYDRNTYTLELSIDNSLGGSVSGDGSYKYGESVTISVTLNDNYTFNGWYEGTEVISTETSYTFTMPASNISYMASLTYNSIGLINYGYSDLLTYDNYEELIKLYNNLYDLCFDFYSGEIDTETRVVSTSSDETSTVYIISGDNKNCYFDEDIVSTDEAKAVYSTLLLDHPEFYFTTGLLVGYSNSSYYLNVVCKEEYVDNSVRLDYLAKINAYKALIKEEIGNTTDEEDIVKIIHDYIVNNSSYAFKEDGETPDDSSYSHNILGIILYNKGVCESYAEVFQLLLRDNGINCIKVTGYGNSAAHAWNYAMINNKWYAFDVTWDDPVTTSGTGTLRYDYYGKGSNSKTFSSSHTPNTEGDMTTGINYLYTLPELASKSLSV